MGETPKDSTPVQRSLSLTFAGRVLLLSVALFLFLILNTVGAGAQTSDDHGNTFGSATPLSLGSSITGRIDPGDDVDAFKLDLSGRSETTDVWIYTTGELDTKGGLYHVDSSSPFLWNEDSFISGRRYNFHLRATLGPGTYYIGVFSFDGATTGNYILHAEVVTDPGNTAGTAKTLNLSAPTAGTIGFAGDNDYFRLDLTKNTHLFLYARSVYGQLFYGYPVDTSDRFVPSNTHVRPDGFAVRDEFGPGTHYIKILTPSSIISHPVPYTIHAFEETSYPTFLEDCQAATFALNEPQIEDSLYGCQWHLRNQGGEDINVEPVWKAGTKGQGVNIATVDFGPDFNHMDLRDNFNTSLNHNYTDTASIFHPFWHHGTYVAGVIGGRDNSVGVRGVAPRATIYSYNYLASGRTDAQRADAMTRNAAVTAVSNNSWGHIEGPGLSNASSFWELAVESGVNSGYGGKGIFYTWAAGNGNLEGDDSNLDELANFYGVTAVCAINDSDIRASYSELGANLWVCAPSGGITLSENRAVVTTENYDRYVYDFNGTSAATPIVSGVAALMRQANPKLTWRDLKLILAASARKNDPTNTGWKDGAREHGSSSASDLYHFNHEYGFGVVDAMAAVDMAKGWNSNLPPLQSSTAASGSLDFPIPDRPITGPPSTFFHELTINTDDIDFTEFVEVNVTFRHSSFRDLKIELVSPFGAVSTLAVPFDTINDGDPSTGFVPLNGTFRFGSARHLGENPKGTWRLRVTDDIPIVSGTWDSWSIKVYGHSGTPASTSACATQGAVVSAAQNPGLVSDCETLLEARDTLVGTGTSLNWSASVPITGWDGVTVEGSPARVTQLSLRNRGLRGTMPAQLGNLTALTRLDLNAATRVCDDGVCQETAEHEHNRLTGEIPAALGDLARLEMLALVGNQLTGPIPPELGNLTDLRLLALPGNQLTGVVPAQLGNLSRLEGLYLWDNDLSGNIPVELGRLTNLRDLQLGRNQLSGSIPHEIGSLHNLQWLSLHTNQLTGQIPSQLGNLNSLKVLGLWDNRFTGNVPPQLGNLTGLERLSLAMNQLTGTIPAQLSSMTSIRLLRLHDNMLTGEIPTNLGSLSNLEELSLSQNRLTGPIPESLGDLSKLQVLSLWSNQLTGTIPTSLIKLANLERLYLSQNQLTGCIPSALQNVADNDLADLALPFCVSPSVTVSASSSSVLVRINSPIPVTATFTEPVSGFAVSDITVFNGSEGNFVGSDGDTVYTFDATPNAIGDVTVDIAADVALDAENNGNTAAIQLSLGIPYDDDHDGAISGSEVLNAVRDYFSGLLTGQQILEVVRLYFSSPG